MIYARFGFNFLTLRPFIIHHSSSSAMSSDGEYEAFQITDDDIANEFGGRRRRRNRKEDAIYGMWAAQDSDDEGTLVNVGKFSVNELKLILCSITSEVMLPKELVLFLPTSKMMMTKTYLILKKR